jgi:hypothetical protein
MAKGRKERRMTQTEWIISLDDDLKDYDELFVGNVRDGDRLIRCKDCIKKELCSIFRNARQELGFCSWGEKKE